MEKILGDGAERVWYNSTDMQILTNWTSESEFRIPADKDNLKNPDDRDGGSLTAFVEGQSSEGNPELTVSDTGNYFQIEVGTGFRIRRCILRIVIGV